MSNPQVGQILYGNPQRDAIHIAICPAVAKSTLQPGERISIENLNGTIFAYPSTPKKDGDGIVDPFLRYEVKSGNKFYIFLHPDTIRSLRHDWICPKFEDQTKSKVYMIHVARDIQWDYDQLMSAAAHWVANKEYAYENNELYKDIGIDWDDFWNHYEILTGHTPEDRSGFFTCSC